MQTLGFIGTGTITAAMVRGLKRSGLADWPIVLSPRSAEIAAELAASLPGVSVAASNQAVIDRSDMVVLAVRPQIAEDVLRALRFRDGQQVVSLIAGVAIPTIAAWTGSSAATKITRAVPLPFVEHLGDAVPVHPPEPDVLALFAALGSAIPVPDAADFDVYAALSALMGSYFGILETAAGWGVAQGLPPADVRAYLSGLFGNLGDVLRADPRPLDALRQAHSTKGGLNEQVFARFVAAGGDTALTGALVSALTRLRGK